MEEAQIDYSKQMFGDINTQVRDLEEKQKIIKDRVLLISKNLIEMREQSNEKILEVKKDIEIMKRTMQKLLSFLEMASNEFSKFATKEDLKILSKQAKMFEI